MCLQVTARSKVLLHSLIEAPHLLNSATMIYFGGWSNYGFEFITHKHLEDDQKMLTAENLKPKNIKNITNAMIEMYQDTAKQAQLYF